MTKKEKEPILLEIEDEEGTFCPHEVDKNIRRVITNGELTRSLASLNKRCNFMEKYDDWCDLKEKMDKESSRMNIQIKCKICGETFTGYYLKRFCKNCQRLKNNARARVYQKQWRIKNKFKRR